ncbi:3-carboxy-cis,cis-muconate cycloisomerase [Robbsia andropogonis]|uniref:3-carboxy-cis,cis-muconate cycloisomerase n=1 Tax=Robbsia andropogonis TaxID=28092 RepID=A0A0F5JWU7_9BURK|nr:3-carboxy-cis,cis-muconate cycloisomerase [Robbsia andropogonis]KKB62336.1 3-carboxy-cis,cis-muconate cycloisomerase [Robbsia andropogonis]
MHPISETPHSGKAKASGRLTDTLYGGRALLPIWDVEATLQRMLDVEAALTRASAEVGVVPRSAVEPIAAACRVENFDIPALLDASATAGNTAIPLVKQLTAVVKVRDADASRFVHWGATSQDIIDTATVLQALESCDVIDAALQRLSHQLATLARAHRDTPQVGRTWLQQALPITLGLKFAQALDAMLRHRARLASAREQVRVLQFGGAAGTLASLGALAQPVLVTLARMLDLRVPDVSWHTQRDRLAELACGWGMLTGSLGKLANDVALQMQTEIGELAEPAGAGKGGSSTMPHKRNPVGCAAVLTAAHRVPPLVATMLGGMVQQHERALGGWQAEWDALPDIARLTSGALDATNAMLDGLNVDTARLSANLELTRGLILGEAVMLALGERLGRMEAHHLVEAASKAAVAQKRPLRDLLQEQPEVRAQLSESQLARLLDPAHYTGQAGAFVDAVLARFDAAN